MAHLGYGWINQTRSLLPTYCADPEQLVRLSPRVKFVMRFMALCGVASFTYQSVVLFTPLKDIILSYVIGVTPEVAAAAKGPLLLFAFIAWPVSLRALSHGWCTAIKATKSMATSALFRFGAVTLGLVLYPQLFPWLAGATLGILALLTGFSAEAIYVCSSAVRIRRQKLRTMETSGDA
jgi:Na+-driven multidrug efflux pump